METIPARHGKAPLAGLPFHELAGHDLLDRARRALDDDAVLLVEQLDDFLARRSQQFSDFVDPNSGQRVLFCAP